MMMIFNIVRTPRQVCDDAEKNDGNNVVSCFSSVGRPSQRVADAQKSRMLMSRTRNMTLVRPYFILLQLNGQ